MQDIITKIHIIDGNYRMYSFNDGERKYIFFITTAIIPGNDKRRRQIKKCLDIYEGADSWDVNTLRCKTHHPFINENNEIDWLSYRSGKLNYPDPFPLKFKKYAQSILNLQAFS